MESFDLVIRRGRVVTDQAVSQCDIAIVDGQIVTIEEEVQGGGRDEIDASGLHVFPGGVDPHVHFDEPGRTEWEGFASGTRALAAGGMTTFIDMPLNCTPVTVDGESFDRKHEAADVSCLVDFAFWGGLIPGNRDHLGELADRGVVGFKAFMCDAGIEEFPAADDLTLFEGMVTAAGLGLPVAVHAENDAITRGLLARARGEGRRSAADFVAARPPIAEIEAIHRAILLAEEAGCSLHVVHVSTARGVMLVDQARARGVDVTCETCPHFLLFVEDDLEELGVAGKCLPPLRTEAERLGLWSLLEAGAIPIVASDHSPAPPSLKTDRDFLDAWGGVSGCQSTLQLLLAAETERSITLSQIAAVLSGNPAERFGLRRKGRLAVGNDADVAIIDLGYDATLQESDLHYRYPPSAYVGCRIRGRMVRILRRGMTIIEDNKFVAAGGGRLVTPRRPDVVTGTAGDDAPSAGAR